MKNNKKLRVVFIILIIIWAISVFNLSNQAGNESGGLSTKITSLFLKSEDRINIVEPYVRKIAHLSEYTLGGILFMGLFLTYNWKEHNKIIFSILIGILYAITDEFHQLFVQDRSGSFFDIIIDSIGVALGVFIMLFISKILEKIKKEKNN